MSAVTLTGAEIMTLVRFLGLDADRLEPDDDALESTITIYENDTKGITDVDSGDVTYYDHIACFSEYPDEGFIGLANPVSPPASPDTDGCTAEATEASGL